MYCQICAKHIQKIKADHRVKGKSAVEVDKYVMGSNYVTKHTCERHLKSVSHSVGVEMDKLCGTPAMGPATATAGQSTAGRQQPRIDDEFHRLGNEAYRKLLKTAYLLAVDGLPLSSFSTMIKVQKSNGVRLISGKQDGKVAKELIHDIALAIKEKLAMVICSAHSFSVLSDGSQARKTGQEKELILIRIVRGGIPVYYCVSLADLDYYGDANAENFKECIDDAFLKGLKLDKEKYVNLMVSTTSDGASVNTGVYNGLLTRLTHDNHTWLLTIHCVSHRCELALKDSLMKQKDFSELKDFMISLYYLCKKSGKFKRVLKKMGDIHNVSVYTFPKVHGTRFIGHTRRGLGALLNNWPILMRVVENEVASPKASAIKATLSGMMKKLKDFKFLSTAAYYKVLLDNLSVFSLALERGQVSVFEVPLLLKNTLSTIETMSDVTYLSCLEECNITVASKGGDDGLEPSTSTANQVEKSPGKRKGRQTRTSQGVEIDNKIVVTWRLPKKEQTRKLLANREFVTLSMDKLTFTTLAAQKIEALKSVIEDISLCLKKRFASFSDPISETVKVCLGWTLQIGMIQRRKFSLF